MSQQPFRIASLGLGVAFLWTVIAAVSHFSNGPTTKASLAAASTESGAPIAAGGEPRTASREDARDALTDAPVFRPAASDYERIAASELGPGGVRIPRGSPRSGPQSPGPLPPYNPAPGHDHIPAPPPLDVETSLDFDEARSSSPEGGAPSLSPFPGRGWPSNGSRMLSDAVQGRVPRPQATELPELPAPASFPGDTRLVAESSDRRPAPAPRGAASPAESFPSQTDVLKELSTLRKELDQFLSHQRLQRLEDLAAASRSDDRRETERALVDLRQALQELRQERTASQNGDRDVGGEGGDDEFAGDSSKEEAAPSEEAESRSTPRSSPVQLAPIDDASNRTDSGDADAQEGSVEAQRPSIRVQPAGPPGYFDFEIDDAKLPELLAALGELGGWNIVVSPQVQGSMTAAWRSVSPQQALDAVLSAHRLAAESQAAFLLVSPAPPPAPVATQASAPEPEVRETLVQMFRPAYVSARDLAPILEPMLTDGVGRLGVTWPQGGTTLAHGGDSLSQPDAIVVVDFPEVVEVIGRTIAEIDVPAPHVELEALVLDVQLSGRLKHGMQGLLEHAELSPASQCVPLGEDCLAAEDVLCCQTSAAPADDLLARLRGWTEVRVVSRTTLQVLNRQEASLHVGESHASLVRCGLWGPRDAQNAPRGAGTKLTIRPFVAADHLIRLDVAPEASAGTEEAKHEDRRVEASLRTNVAVPNGGSVVVAGLDLERSTERAPWTSDPLGLLRRTLHSKHDSAERRELVVIITPRIVAELPSCAAAECLPMGVDTSQFPGELLTPPGMSNRAPDSMLYGMPAGPPSEPTPAGSLVAPPAPTGQLIAPPAGAPAPTLAFPSGPLEPAGWTPHR